MGVKQLFDLAGRSAVVTGGSRGLGLQMAEALGEMGARIAITARKKDELEEAVAHLKSSASPPRPTRATSESASRSNRSPPRSSRNPARSTSS